MHDGSRDVTAPSEGIPFPHATGRNAVVNQEILESLIYGRGIILAVCESLINLHVLEDSNQAPNVIRVGVTKYEDFYVTHALALKIGDQVWAFALRTSIDENIPAVGSREPSSIALTYIDKGHLQ